MGKNDPYKDKPKRRVNTPHPGKKSSSIGPAIAFIVVLIFAAKGCDTTPPDVTPVPPTQTERR
jgi:hypothetical protein